MSAEPGRAAARRDRDDAGRARNARPRDAYGRPLPHGADGAVERVPDDLVLAPAETLAEAQRLIDEGHPFTAHEILEAAWKNGPAGERELWQGLAQVAVGLTHGQRGNATGAARLLRRGAERIAGYAEAPPYRIAVTGVIAGATGLAERIEAGDLAGIDPADLRIRLT